MIEFEKELRAAVRRFWLTRSSQSRSQGSATGLKDSGDRAAVTGGKHPAGIVHFIANIVKDAGLKDCEIHWEKKRERTLPGYFRPSKDWDLVIRRGETLIAVVEVKSHVGSFGNNFNNRVEEALGNATDFWKAYERGIFALTPRPWLGYFLLVEESEKSIRPTKSVPMDVLHVDPAFHEKSYVARYEEVCRRLVRERQYDAACLITSSASGGRRGAYSEPASDISPSAFVVSLHARAKAFAMINTN